MFLPLDSTFGVDQKACLHGFDFVELKFQVVLGVLRSVRSLTNNCKTRTTHPPISRTCFLKLSIKPVEYCMFGASN